MNLQRYLPTLSLFTLLVLSAACNVSSEGALGNLAFTPQNCGRLSCDFDDSVGVGGAIELQLSTLKEVSTVGAVIESDTPDLLSVQSVPDVNGQPTWELIALAAGVAQITVVTPTNEVLDTLEIAIQDLTGIVGRNTLGDAVGPSDSPDFDEVWTINADQNVTFRVTPVIGIDAPTMGRYTYTATVDANLEAALLDSVISDGRLHFNAPAGEYDATFEDDFGHIVTMHFIAQ